MSSCLKDEFDYSNHQQSALDLCHSLERYSVSILRPKVDYPTIKEKYLNEVNNDMSSEVFFAHTKHFLLHFADPHIRLQSAFENMYSIDNLNYTRNISLNIIQENYLENEVKHHRNIVSGTIQDSIGYLHLSDFGGENHIIEPILHDIIDRFSDKTGLIIDLRENDGGSAYNAQSLLNKLTTQKLLWHTTKNRIENGFDEKYEWYISPAGNYQFTRKVIVLTGRYTVSAGERFVIGAKILPHLQIMGDTTANTQGSVMGREMINGWSYTFTFERVLSPDSVNYEGIGITPDSYIPSHGLDFSSRDMILERAISELQ